MWSFGLVVRQTGRGLDRLIGAASEAGLYTGVRLIGQPDKSLELSGVFLTFLIPLNFSHYFISFFPF